MNLNRKCQNRWKFFALFSIISFVSYRLTFKDEYTCIFCLSCRNCNCSFALYFAGFADRFELCYGWWKKVSPGNCQWLYLEFQFLYSVFDSTCKLVGDLCQWSALFFNGRDFDIRFGLGGATTKKALSRFDLKIDFKSR